MSSDGISLHRADHSQSILEVFEKLLESSSLVDCTIAAEGQYLKAHRVILSACSPYFEMLFRQETEKNPIVVLKDTKFEDLKSVIDFVYRGQVNIPEGRFRSFADTVDSLQIKGMGSGSTETNGGNRENRLSLVHRREGRASPIARKRMRSSSPNTSDNVSQQFPTLPENMNHFPTTNESVFEQFSGNDFQTSSSEQLFRVERNSLNQYSISEANTSKEFSTVNVNVLNQYASGCVNISNQLPHTITNASATKCTVSSENDSCDRRPPPPENVIFSSKSVLSCEVTSNRPQYMCTLPSEQCPTLTQPLAVCATSELSAQCSLLPAEEAVVKVEPEPMAEVFLPESECSLEPKDEIVVEESPIFASEEENTEQLTQDCRHEENTNEVFPSLIEATNVLPDDRFLVQQVPKCTSGQGAVQVSGASAAQQQQQAAAAARDPLRHEAPQAVHVTGLSHAQEQPTAAAAPPPPPPPSECRDCRRAPRVADQDSSAQQHRCQHCGKMFREVGLLRVHQRVHTKERPFRCDSCDASFTHRSSLITHKRGHAGDKRYQCSACRKTFGRIGDLLIHRRLVCLSRGSPGDG